MIDANEIKRIKETVEELLQKMTITVFSLEAKASSVKNEKNPAATIVLQEESQDKDFIELEATIEEPQVLIGQGGQTLFELQRLLRIMLTKKLKKNFYVTLDINEYKKKKIEYLKKMATDLADEVSLNKEKKVLPPMPAYERRIIHAELAQRSDVATISQGEGADRCVVITPK